MTTASKITLVRVVLIPVYMVLMLLSANGAEWLRWAAVAVFVIASISDFLDGYIARHYNQVSDFGKFLDPLADKLLVTACMMIFVGWGRMPSWLVFIVIAREFAISGLRMVAANNGRVGYHIHVSEGMNDVYDSLQNYGRRPVQRLQDHNILGPKTILGHCIHVNTAEMDIIKATDTMCVNNPESNMGNAVGISPVLQLYKKGILIGMGTDAYTNDMLESLKVALCSQRSQNCLPNVAWCEVTDMLFKNNAKIGARYFPQQLGVLKAGAAADIIVMDYKPYTPFSDENIDGHMIFGMTGRQCQTTIAAGKLLMKDRVLVNIDEEAENAHILEAAKKLWGDLNHRVY